MKVRKCMTFPSPPLCLSLTQCKRSMAVSLSSLASPYGSGLQKDSVHGCAWFKPPSSAPPQIWTPAWSWEPVAESLGSGQMLRAPALPLSPCSNPPDSTYPLQRLLSSPGSPPPQPRLPCSPHSECPQHRDLHPETWYLQHHLLDQHWSRGYHMQWWVH